MKSIPLALQAHMNQNATTLCQLVLVETKGGLKLGFTNLDRDIVFDNGNGPVTFVSTTGFVPSRYQATADMSVDNAEIEGILSAAGITQEDVAAGLFHMAKVWMYEVNYLDLSMGSHILGYGRLGATRFSSRVYVTEFRSLVQLLRQTISRLYSLTCRAVFGSKPYGTNDGSFEEKYPCGKDFTWFDGVVTAVEDDGTLIFADATMTADDGYFDGGVVKFVTGDNAGHEMDVDVFYSTSSADPTFTLALPMPFPINPGDIYQSRKDCSKVWDDEANGCLFHWGSERANHFRGEPKIPVSDAGQSMVPGAQIPRSS